MFIEAGDTVIFSISDPTKGWDRAAWTVGKYLDSVFIPDSIEPRKCVQVLDSPDATFKRGENIYLGPRVSLIKILQADPKKDLCQAPGTEEWITNIKNELYWLALIDRIKRVENLGL